MSAAMTFAEAPPAQQPLKIVISTERSLFRPGDVILVKVEVTNNSNGDVDVSSWVDRDSGIPSQHIYDVRKDTGELVPLKKTQPQPPEQTGSDNWLKPKPPAPAETAKIVLGSLKPGEKYATVDDINRVYDLSQPGKYTIQVAHPLPGKGKDDVVKSNRITITITPP